MADWYCPLPFKHAYVDSTGVACCCKSPRQAMTISQYENSDFLNQIQQQILQGIVPKSCQSCVADENVTGFSLRLDSLNDYPNRVEQTDIDFIDYRSNNICNFKCRSCNPAFSHGIANEVKNNDVLKNFHRVIDTKTVRVSDDNTSWINKNLHRLKRLMLTGGEPTRMPEIKQILERVLHEKLDIQILITTNASFEDDFWCELTRNTKNLHWTVSLDAVGSAAEIIRHGTKWSVVERNARWLSQHATSLDFNTVITNLNVMQLRPLLEFVGQMKLESAYPRGLQGSNGCRHQFHVSKRPYYLAADNWPDDLRGKAIDRLSQCLTLYLDDEQKQTVSGLLMQIQNSDFDAALWAKTLQYNTTLDGIRGEDHRTLYN